MDRHLERFLLHHLLEPVRVNLLVRSHIDLDYHRTVVHRLEAIDALVSGTQLHSEIIEIELVKHPFGADGHALERVIGRRLEAVYPEL